MGSELQTMLNRGVQFSSGGTKQAQSSIHAPIHPASQPQAAVDPSPLIPAPQIENARLALNANGQLNIVFKDGSQVDLGETAAGFGEQAEATERYAQGLEKIAKALSDEAPEISNQLYDLAQSGKMLSGAQQRFSQRVDYYINSGLMTNRQELTLVQERKAVNEQTAAFEQLAERVLDVDHRHGLNETDWQLVDVITNSMTQDGDWFRKNAYKIFDIAHYTEMHPQAFTNYSKQQMKEYVYGDVVRQHQTPLETLQHSKQIKDCADTACDGKFRKGA
ncbi:MAG: hypothetical protein SFZ03_12270 [Candidatus Melainabacteria bacterium]|nr:hypothetical protein [Candidatus Melainabacteria bacterium]